MIKALLVLLFMLGTMGFTLSYLGEHTPAMKRGIECMVDNNQCRGNR